MAFVWSVAVMLAMAPGAVVEAAPQDGRQVLRLATTTSTADSGLLTAILPAFERQCGCRVDVVAVGTGQALALGRQGDVDVVLVHARKAEEQFTADGFATERHDVMYNDFVLVGPAADPAKIATMAQANEAFAAIARAGAPFISRGDRSGTHMLETAVWAELKMTPALPWYRSVGQGMGETLVVANEMGGYTLTDRATWLATSKRLTGLRLLVGGKRLAENRDRTLLNPYGVLPVNPARHPGVRADLANTFVSWLVSAPTQTVIGEFGVAKFGQPLFYPSARGGRK
jgi:tungstate transport system substrate-binding protein